MLQAEPMTRVLGDAADPKRTDERFELLGQLVAAGDSVLSDGRIVLWLREPGETAYRIPRGGLYRFISCPNYFGELVQWAGWAVATWSLAGLSFAVFTAANLVPRALSHHRWYRSEFDDYPEGRHAVVPFVL